MKYRKLTSLLCVTAITATALAGCGKGEEKTVTNDINQSEIDAMDSVISEFDASGLIKHSDETGKEETVYVIMDANGANPSTIVSEWLKNPQGIQTLTDNSTLDNIEVVKGAASLISAGNGSLEWNADGEDVFYRGTTEKELPVSIDVKYTLDGTPVDAASLVNATGHVKIEYSYDNKVYKVMNIGDEECNIYQPFTTITGMLLDDEKVANVKVTDGKVINSGNYSIVFGIAMPGLTESLGLDELAEEKDINIPESVTIEADVTDFSMPMSMTVVSNNALSTLDIDNINSIDELRDKITALTDGMDQLIDGSDKLNDGMNELSDGTDELAGGVSELDEGAGKLNDGAKELSNGAGELKDGAGQLYDGTTSLHDGSVKLAEGLNTLNGKTPELASGVSQLKDGAVALTAGVSELNSNSAALNDGAAQLAGGLAQLNESLNAAGAQASGMGELVAGSGRVKAGIESLGGAASAAAAGLGQAPGQDQIDSINSALNGLKEQLNSIPEGDPAEGLKNYIDGIDGALQVINGYKQITDGVGTAVNGMNEGLNGDGTGNNPGLVASYAQIDAGIQTAAGTVGGSMGQIKDAVGKLSAGANSLQAGIGQYTAGVAKVYDGAGKLSDGTIRLNDSVPALVNGVTQLSDGANALEAGAASLKDGAGKLYDGTGKLSNGANELFDGTTSLKDGTNKLNEGVIKLTDGVGELTDGTGKLKDGIIKFNDEGISKIADIVNNDLEVYYDRLCAVRDFSKEYTSFTSADKNADNSVKFIYKTNAAE